MRFALKQPNAPFLADLAMDFASIQSKEYADALLKAGKPELIDQEPIGTGPFEFVSYQQGQHHPLPRVRRITGAPKPKIDTLVFSITKDPAVRLAKLRANECQMAPLSRTRPTCRRSRPTRTCSCCRSPA